MGAAVASLAVASSAAHINHLVLEAPFNNLADEVNVFLFNEMILCLFWKRMLHFLCIFLSQKPKSFASASLPIPKQCKTGSPCKVKGGGEAKWSGSAVQ